MNESMLKFDLPQDNDSIIKVIGVGGGGGNAVNYMCRQGIKDVQFMVCNTDAQALENSPVKLRVHIGSSLTEGRGAGNKPDVGREAAKENIEEIRKVLERNTKMVFITAGMGGGTGTGAAPVIAEEARNLGLLTVGIVTIPFRNEGRRRISQALEGISQLQKHVDSLLVINNERIREMYGDFKISEAFEKADNVLAIAAKGIAEIITVHGYINVDFADVETVMRESGVAIMGSAKASGENRAIKAVEEALNSPLLNNNDITGARNILLNVTSGTDEITMDEIGQITDYIQDKAGCGADLIWGNGGDESLGEEINVTIIATGFNTSSIPELMAQKKQQKTYHTLEDPVHPEKKMFSTVKQVLKQKVNPSGDASNSQRTFEFDVRQEYEDDVQKLYGNSSEKKSLDDNPESQAVSLKMDFYEASDESLDALANVPAYKRKGIKFRKGPNEEAKEVSRYSLSEDKDKNITIRKDNSFLHDNID
ncbi:cell division protein FtsZ [Puteibacter caeruleilacunae]|nr:cell division protein FtsZ [Puteibacter caeruleilacunae]